MVDAVGQITGLSVKQAQDPAKARDAARQFEALLLTQILKSARTGGDEDSVNELADQQLALALAERGGLGLSELITKGLEKR